MFFYCDTNMLRRPIISPTQNWVGSSSPLLHQSVVRPVPWLLSFLLLTALHLDVRTNQSASINHAYVYHLSITSSITRTLSLSLSLSVSLSLSFFLSQECSARREAHTERIYQQSPYEGSGNLNIHCWHCADLAGGQGGPASSRPQNIPLVWIEKQKSLSPILKI